MEVYESLSYPLISKMEEEILKNITSIKYILATICVYTIISDIFKRGA
tara:strand:+ start:470 stop:613 length:144 start_codon:yes stop_codon:yes gene_type:complete